MSCSYCRKWIAACSFCFLVLSSLLAQTAYAIDFIAPQIEHVRATDSIARGDDHLITAVVTDDTEVANVILHYRVTGTRNFSPLEMHSLDGSSLYETVIVGHKLDDGALEYFFEAADSSGNTLEMYGSNGEPFAISPARPAVNLASLPKPIDEDGNKVHASGRPVLPVKKKSDKGRWLWVGLGVLAAAVIVGAAGSSPGPTVGGDGGGNTGDLDIDTPVPQN